MKEEHLDIVDENNKLTGEVKKRSKVHAEGMWHRVVHIYLFRKRSGKLDFLVHLRSPDKDISPNKWDVRFGGHVESGEAIKGALAKETREEIGLDVSNALVIEGDWFKDNKHPNCEFAKLFFLEFNEDAKNLKFNDGEVQEVKWISSSEILERMKKEPENWTSGVEEFTKIRDQLLSKLK